MTIYHVRDNVFDTAIGRVALAVGSFDLNDTEALEDAIVSVFNNANSSSIEPEDVVYTSNDL
tara:strand:- start:309 stop:494 length:186 start_codon:yes stop_codon:yes gene_type:complete